MKDPNRARDKNNDPSFVLEVNVLQDERGRLWSKHDFQSPEDQQKALRLPNFGVPQIARALLTEALRREVYAVILTKLSQNTRFLEEWQGADDARKRDIEAEMARVAREIITGAVDEMNPAITREVFTMLTAQRQAVTGDSR